MQKIELEDLIEFSRTIKVLYVEDNNIMREASLDVFNIFFEQIDAAKNGVDGFEHFTNNKYNLIITAIDMPLMNGIEMISKIRQISKDITILVISADEDKEHFMDLIKLGIDGYILKPVKVKQFVEVIKKVIEKFKNKQELYEHKNNLESMVSAKTLELQLLNRSLHQKVEQEVQKNLEKEQQLFEQSKMAAMGEMIANIAHQWRQPLSAISSVATGTQTQLHLGILEDEDILSNMSLIVDNTQYLSDTIETFRNFIKKDKEITDVVLQDSIDQILNIVKTALNNHHIELKKDIDHKNKIKTRLSAGELSQVLINIINNAKDVLLENKIEKPWIEISLKKNKKTVLITIEDNAGGIPSDIMPKIFEPYFTTKHQSQGTGLGLHMSYKIMTQSFGGKLYVKNTKNGAKFFIEIPSAPREI